MKKATVFFSWQSDIKHNRGFIERALERAAKEVANDDSIGIEPVVDRDTRGVPGSPDIGATILAKVREADVFVGDVTIVNGGSPGRLTPNPNVLVEVGYALASLGEPRIVLVLNKAFGTPEDLPFDLRQKRAIVYELPADATDDERAGERKKLVAVFRDALRAILVDGGVKDRDEYPVELTMEYGVYSSTQTVHEYTLRVVLKNTGTKRIEEWHVEIAMPTEVLDRNRPRPLSVRERSTPVQTLFRVSEGQFGTLFPGDAREMLVPYRMDNDMYWNRRAALFPKIVTATAFVHGKRAAAVEKVFEKLQRF